MCNVFPVTYSGASRKDPDGLENIFFGLRAVAILFTVGCIPLVAYTLTTRSQDLQVPSLLALPAAINHWSSLTRYCGLVWTRLALYDLYRRVDAHVRQGSAQLDDSTQETPVTI